jgi:serine/threonine-protein phosphatase CPPED1
MKAMNPCPRFLLVALAAASLFAAAPVRAQDLWFLQMSDPQFGMYANNENFTQETANFEFVIAAANRLHPRFIVICGDLINKPGDLAQASEFHRIAAKLDKSIALHLVAGNHDVENSPTPASLQSYRKAFGKDYYAFDYPGFRGIVVDSSLMQHPEAAAEDAARQDVWLAAELTRARQSASTVAIFQHIPLFVEKADEADGYFNIPRPARAHYLRMLQDSGVRYVFAGHTHYAASAKGAALAEFIAGPVGKPLGSGASGMRIVHLTMGRLEEQFVDLAHLPNRLEETFAPVPKAAVPAK